MNSAEPCCILRLCIAAILLKHQQTSRVARNSEERGGGGGFADFVGVFCLRNHSRNSRNKSNQSECSTAHVCLQSLSANLINWRMDFYFPVRCLGFNLYASEPRSLGEMTRVDFLRRIISRVRARQTSVCGAEKWDKAHKHTRSLGTNEPATFAPLQQLESIHTTYSYANTRVHRRHESCKKRNDPGTGKCTLTWGIGDYPSHWFLDCVQWLKLSLLRKPNQRTWKYKSIFTTLATHT